MPRFKTLEGDVLSYGKEGAYTRADEIAFILSLDKQSKAANLKVPEHVSALQFNVNQIAEIINLAPLKVTGVTDENTVAALDYVVKNMDLFKEHGITGHLTAKKMEKVTNPAFTETEHAPTIEEMKALEIDIGKLYDQA